MLASLLIKPIYEVANTIPIGSTTYTLNTGLTMDVDNYYLIRAGWQTDQASIALRLHALNGSDLMFADTAAGVNTFNNAITGLYCVYAATTNLLTLVFTASVATTTLTRFSVTISLLRPK